MICSHCNTSISLEIDFQEILITDKINNFGCEVYGGVCPECNQPIIYLKNGFICYYPDGECYLSSNEPGSNLLIYPKYKVRRKLADEIPNKYKSQYNEIEIVLEVSPKASSALSRRLLQQLLRDECNVKHNDLYKEIDEFIKRQGTPSYIFESLDAVRKIGNFAAHPIKSTNTGEIVDVEPGEAEFILDIFDMLFDFIFIQPAKIKRNIEMVNRKIEEAVKKSIK